MKKTLSIVIPVYNEEETIPKLIKELVTFINRMKKYSFEIIIVENGSNDSSYQLLVQYAKKDRRIKILQLSKNFTAEGGIAAGMYFAQGEACIITMADLQEPVEIIEKFINKWEQGYEIVYGIVRKRTAGFFRNVNSIIFYKLLNILTHTKFPENVSDFRLIDKKVYTVINKMPEQNKYLRGLIMWTGFSHTGIQFDRRKRFAGKSKADFSSVISIAMNAVFSFSYIPLRIISIMGLGITGITFILIIFYFILFLIYGRIAPGTTTIILIMLFLFGMLFFTLGIISEYLVRIYEEVKKRPQFIVKNKINLI